MRLSLGLKGATVNNLSSCQNNYVPRIYRIQREAIAKSINAARGSSATKGIYIESQHAGVDLKVLNNGAANKAFSLAIVSFPDLFLWWRI